MEKIVVPKENAFNFLRLICALIVIYEHSVLLSGSKILPCMGLREIAVNVFFILSGFWVTQSYLRSSSVKEYVIVMWIAFRFKLFYSIGSKKDYSYSMYLVHYPLIMCSVSLSLFEKNWIFAFICILGLTFLISYILEKIMEVLNVNCKHRVIQNTNSTNQNNS